MNAGDRRYPRPATRWRPLRPGALIAACFGVVALTRTLNSSFFSVKKFGRIEKLFEAGRQTVPGVP